MFGFTFKYEENNDLLSNDDCLCSYKSYFCNWTRTKLKDQLDWTEKYKQNQIKPNQTQIRPN